MINRITLLLLFIGLVFFSCEDNIATNEFADTDNPSCGFGELYVSTLDPTFVGFFVCGIRP